MKITLTVNGAVFPATLADTEAARALATALPQTFSMSELNGNEKYAYMGESLPTASERVESIEAGDIMLFGNDCLVLFYKSFSTSYSYTRVGRLDDASGIAKAAGAGAVEVRFELA